MSQDSLTSNHRPTKQPQGFMRFVPQMLWWLIAYSAIAFGVQFVGEISLQSTILSLGTYVFTFNDVLLTVAGLVCVTELGRVSYPGMNNTTEAIVMAILWIVMLVGWIVLTFVFGMKLFATAGYLIVLVKYAVTCIYAFIINGRTLVRAFGAAME